MIKNALKGLSLFLAVCCLQGLLQRTAYADEVVELPPEELATESVYPVFDKPVSVRNRNVLTAKHWEIGGYYGMAMTEPIFNVSKVGISGYYHFSEIHALGLAYEKNSSGLSKYGQQLTYVPNNSGGPPTQLDFTRAPAPVGALLLDYNFNAFYGKMSLSKSVVFNLITFASTAFTMNQYQNKTYPGIALGLGQKYYLSRQFSLRLDLRFYANNAPVPFLHGDTTTPGVDIGSPKPGYSAFNDTLTYTTNMSLGVNYLF